MKYCVWNLTEERIPQRYKRIVSQHTTLPEAKEALATFISAGNVAEVRVKAWPGWWPVVDKELLR